MREMVASLARLNEGLRVKHIAASPLLTCPVSEDTEQASSRPEFEGIDQIPLMERGSNRGGLGASLQLEASSR